MEERRTHKVAKRAMAGGYHTGDKAQNDTQDTDLGTHLETENNRRDKS